LMLWTGSFNVAASVPPGNLEESLARFALDRAVRRRAPFVKNPVASSPETLREGLSHYRGNCLGCHGAPGVDAAEYGQGLNPAAPDLTLPRVQKRPDGELFWITANGIRMTGMPAFSPTHREEEIWKIVAFLRHLPELTPGEEKELAAAAEEAEHHHEAAAERTTTSGAAETAKRAHTHPPGTKPHKD
ncbi:MAG: c-type cytochrome, partial [Thermoanaerobaculia bacterium]